MRRRIKVKGVNYLHFVGPCENISQTETFALFFCCNFAQIKRILYVVTFALGCMFSFRRSENETCNYYKINYYNSWHNLIEYSC